MTGFLRGRGLERYLLAYGVLSLSRTVTKTQGMLGRGPAALNEVTVTDKAATTSP